MFGILLGDRLSYTCPTSVALFDVVPEAERHHVDQSGLIKIVAETVLLIFRFRLSVNRRSTVYLHAG